MDNNQINTNEVSLIELIENIKKYSFIILKNWKTILIITLPILLFMLYRVNKTPTTYETILTFMVNEDEGGLGVGSAASGILGTLGLASQEYNLDKILQLSKSNRIINEALFSKGTIDGKEDFFANHLLAALKTYDDKWKKNKIISAGFVFTHGDSEKFNRTEWSVAKWLLKRVIGTSTESPLFNTSYSKESGIMKLSVETNNEELSIEFIKAVYTRLGEFYITKSIEKQRYTYEVIINKADSIKQLLQGKEVSRAKFDDRNRGLISETSKVPAQRLSRDFGMLNIMYNEAIKNAEVADFAIKSKIPFIQSIDIPIAPIQANIPSYKMAILISLIVGFILSSIFIIGKNLVAEQLQNN